MKTKNVKEFVALVFKAVSLAMGVAVVALSIMNKIETDSAITMLGIGVAALGATLLANR